MRDRLLSAKSVKAELNPHTNECWFELTTLVRQTGGLSIASIISFRN